MKFAKYSAAGNDFVLIDNRDKTFDSTLVPSLCARQEGIGADGVILWEKGKKAEFLLRIFNPDGSEAEMCGNGLRAYVKFIFENGVQRPSYTIENIEGKIYEGSLTPEGTVKIVMAPPTAMQWNIALPLFKTGTHGHFLNTGVPHTVIFTPHIASLAVLKWGRCCRFHPHFAPAGTNVNFVERREDELWIRTYERGVEAETLACGTGSVAAALVAAHLFHLPAPITLHVRSGALLKVDFQKNGNDFSHITLEGPAKKVFEGNY